MNRGSLDLIQNLNFCVIDLETTGGNHENDKIIEIGLVKIQSLKITEKMSFLLDPKKPIPEFIQRLTSIKQKDVKGKDLFEDVASDILNFIGDDILVAHNTSFDVPFLNSEFLRMGLNELENKVICTNVMTKHLIPNITNSNLTYMSQLFDLTHQHAHRALDDAIACAELLIQYLHIFIDKGITKVNQLYYPKNKFELDRAHFQSDQLDSLFEKLKQTNQSGHITFKGEKGLILAVIPSKDLSQEIEFVKKIHDQIDYTMITVKLCSPFLEALLLYASHYFKLPEKMQKLTLSYIKEKNYDPKNDEISLEKVDFIIANHIINKQIVYYSFLNLNLKNKNVFKVPSQQKKMHQSLISQINRFENNQKGQRKTFIPKEVSGIIENYLGSTQAKKSYLYLSRKTIKQDQASYLKTLGDFTKQVKNTSPYPLKHL